MSKATPESTSVDDNQEIRQRAFERKARQATHQILFYLGLYYYPIKLLTRTPHNPTIQVLKRDSKMVLTRLQALVDGVGYRGDDVETETWRTLRKKITCCESLWPYKVRDGESPRDERTGENLAEKSQSDDEETRKNLDGLRNDCKKFLEESEPQDKVASISHFLNNLSVRLHRWPALIILSVAAVVVLGYLPQVSGLLSQSWGVLLPFLLFLILAKGPDLLARLENKWNDQQYWWDLGGQPFRNLDARPPERGFDRFAKGGKLPLALTTRTVEKLVWHLVFTIPVLLLTILVAHWHDMILHTVAQTLFLFYALYVVARLLDFWDYYDAAPVRMLFLLLLLFALWGVNTYHLWLAPGLLWLVFVIVLAVLIFSKARKKNVGRLSAVASGLFVLAWFFTNIAVTQFGEPWRDDGSTNERLAVSEWPKSVRIGEAATRDEPVVVLAASGGGSRAAIYVAHTLLLLHEKKFSHIGCNLQAISSVSGGSLANAVYVTLRRGQTCGEEQLLSRLQGEDGLLKKVSGDFLRPTISGAVSGTIYGLLGNGGRSEGIEKAWKNIGLDVDLTVLATEWMEAAKTADYPEFPIPLFNATSLEMHRVVLSPLERAFYTDPVVSGSARDPEVNLYDRLSERLPDEFSRETKDPSWVYYRDGIYGLDDLLPQYTPNLAQCVRASANFPVGFPLVKVETKRPLFYSPSVDRRARGDIYLSDGGVLSNSGVISLYHLLRNQENNLKDRGVLVIIVDASAMQTYKVPKRIEGLFNAIDSQQPIGQSMHRRMFESLKHLYGERIQIVQIDLIPTNETNIETTWALSAERQESLENQFKARRDEFEEDLNAAWNVLVSKEGVGPKRYLERPPTD